jgi:hypothetical protein
MPHARPDGAPFYKSERRCCVQPVISDVGGDASALFFAQVGNLGEFVGFGSSYLPIGAGEVASFGLVVPTHVVENNPLFSWLFS